MPICPALSLPGFGNGYRQETAEKKAPVHLLDLADWQRVIGIDLTGGALCNKQAVARMLTGGGGSIVNMASILAHVALTWARRAALPIRRPRRRW
ncbi:hypothetical protein GCM10027514_35320 [Azotobacter armeniacus]